MNIVKASHALDDVRPGDKILISGGCGEPLTLLDTLVKEKERFDDISIYTGILFGQSPLYGQTGKHINLTTWQSSPEAGPYIAGGTIKYLPLRYSQILNCFLPGGILQADTVFIKVSPPDNNGYCCIGSSPAYALPVALGARTVLAEIHEDIPKSHGNCYIHTSKISSFVESVFPISEFPKKTITKEEFKIAEHVAALVEDGSTIETGIGGITSAVTQRLCDKRNLGIFSGMICEEVIDLVESGAIKTHNSYFKNRIVSGELVGSTRLLSYVNENPIFEMATVDVTHNPLVIGNISNFVAINSAVEIDLSGQVNSEMVNNFQISGVGGAFDFCMGASMSKGGKSIIALTSTTRNGKYSKIIHQIKQGTSVTIPRHFVDYVVTEYGIANLAGKDMWQRAESLIEVAHPKFREQLVSCINDLH
jgi:4-hydroxybutyrate CoA-transferase